MTRVDEATISSGFQIIDSSMIFNLMRLLCCRASHPFSQVLKISPIFFSALDKLDTSC